MTETLIDADAPAAEDQRLTREQVRAAAPVVVAVALLFGLLVGGALLLRDVLDLGVWLLSSR